MSKPKTIDPERLRSLNNLLAEGLLLPASQRAQWLASLPPEHQALVAPLKALLARADVDTDDFLRQPAATTLEGWADDAEVGLSPGDTIGPYRLQRELGSGGMARVWLADRVEGTRRNVALKLPYLGWSPGIERRVTRERDILAALEHANIARLYEAGVTPEGRPWLAMEYVQGLTLDEHCREQRLGLRERLALFLQVADAVAYAHSRMVVHRDLKPSNMLVTASGDVRLLDFGIAKLLADDEAQGPTTRTLDHALTPVYAAPEQVSNREVTAATDVYALGIVLYELLTGQRPYDVSSATQGGLDAAFQAAAVPSASTTARHDARLARQLRGDLDNILTKALQKSPAMRYPSVEAFASDLRRYLAGEPVLAQPPGRWYRLSKFVRRNRGAVASAAALLLTIAAGSVGTLTQASRAQAEARAAQAERDAAERELRYAEASEAFLRFILSERSSRPFTTAELLARADALVDTQHQHDAELRARLQMVVANLFGEQRDYKSALRVIERAQASATVAGHRALRAEVDCRLAELEAATGAVDKADARFAAAIGGLSETLRNEATALASCYRGRGGMNARRLRTQAAMDDAQTALKLIGIPRPAQQQTVVSLHLIIAAVHLEEGRIQEAIDTYEQQLRSAEGGASGLGMLGSAIGNNLGVTLGRVGQWQQASLAYQRGLALAGPAGKPRDHALLVNHARMLIDLGRAEDAIPLLQSAGALAVAAGDRLFQGLAEMGLASAHCELNQWGPCDTTLKAARATLQGVVPPERAIWATPDMLDAQAALAANDAPRARQLLSSALTRFNAAKDTSASRARALGRLARVEAQLGNHADASDHAAAAMGHARQISKGMAHSAWVGAALLDRAVVHELAGQREQARQDLADALDHLKPTAGPVAPITLEAEQRARELAR